MNHLKSVVIAGMLSASALPAFALTPNQVPVANRLDIGGATATNTVLGRLFLIDPATAGVNAPCAPGSIHVYSAGTQSGAAADTNIPRLFNSTGAPAGSRGYAVLCTASADTGALAGTPIGIFKEANGGSENGVEPVFYGTNLNFLNIGTAAAPTGCGAAVAFGAGVASVAFTAHFGCNVFQGRPPRVGVSDVEPARLSPDPVAVAGLAASGTVHIVFAHAATGPLYNALQTIEGLAGTGPAGVPSLTPQQFAGLETGLIPDWTFITNDAGSAALAPADTTVYLCRRGNTSGTEATFEINDLNQRCATGVSQMRTASQPACDATGCVWNAATFGTDATFAGSGSGDVIACMLHHNNAGHYAIGFLSTETNPTAFSTGNGGYLGVNRANPDLVSAASGNYNLWSENTLNSGGASGAATATQSTIRTFITSNFGDPEAVKTVNLATQWAQGDGGLLALPFTPANPPAPPFDVAKFRTLPVNPATRSPLGSVNNCNPPTTNFSPSEAGGEGEEENTQGGNG